MSECEIAEALSTGVVAAVTTAQGRRVRVDTDSAGNCSPHPARARLHASASQTLWR